MRRLRVSPGRAVEFTPQALSPRSAAAYDRREYPTVRGISMKRPIAALAAFSIAAFLANAASAADAQQGGELAKRWCATCHVVAPDQASGGTQAPPFAEIAKKPGLTAASIALFLLRPHPPMPDMNLSRGEAADLAAYIVSQK
jgi:mono/diheme cytochrome c family protein